MKGIEVQAFGRQLDHARNTRWHLLHIEQDNRSREFDGEDIMLESHDASMEVKEIVPGLEQATRFSRGIHIHAPDECLGEFEFDIVPGSGIGRGPHP